MTESQAKKKIVVIVWIDSLSFRGACITLDFEVIEFNRKLQEKITKEMFRKIDECLVHPAIKEFLDQIRGEILQRKTRLVKIEAAIEWPDFIFSVERFPIFTYEDHRHLESNLESELKECTQEVVSRAFAKWTYAGSVFDENYGQIIDFKKTKAIKELFNGKRKK